MATLTAEQHNEIEVTITKALDTLANIAEAMDNPVEEFQLIDMLEQLQELKQDFDNVITLLEEVTDA